MGSFMIGVLGTTGPRLLDACPLIAAETSALLILQMVSALLHLVQRQTVGDIVFLVLLLFFAGMMVVQFFVVLATYPETKGYSLEEMQRKLGIE